MGKKAKSPPIDESVESRRLRALVGEIGGRLQVQMGLLFMATWKELARQGHLDREGVARILDNAEAGTTDAMILGSIRAMRRVVFPPN